MADEPSAMSVKERIAQLKLNQVGRVPETPPPSYDQVTNGSTWARTKAPPPPPPPRPGVLPRLKTSTVPTANYGVIGNQPQGDGQEVNGSNGVPRPTLPPRTSTQSSLALGLPPRKASEPSPALPPRRPSETLSSSDYRLSRRDSNGSISSVATGMSSVSGISNSASITSSRSVKAPAFDPSALPALPPKRTDEDKQAYYESGNKAPGRRPLKSMFSSPNILPKQNGTTAPPTPRRPSAQGAPQLPSRSNTEVELRQIEAAPTPSTAARPSLAQPPKPKKSPLTFGLSNAPNSRPPLPSNGTANMRDDEAPPPLPGARSTSVGQIGGAPPPIPTSSRPDLSGLKAFKPKPNGTAPPASTPAPQGFCLHCRDFSAVDAHAARFPRQSINQDVGWLAHQLCDPYPSNIDKARAIFTWLHHNIFYDTQAFFSGKLKPSTPQSTLASGWAVCEGYAGLFAALALAAGLEAVVVGGNGKGYGYSQLKFGESVPPYSGGHAWNAVKVDSADGRGQWKLIDACWGAGHICGSNNLYKQAFAPERFTQSNEEFGLDHYPEDPAKQYRSDGRRVSWEEYITGNKRDCGADFFSGYTSAEGISEPSFRPMNNPIVLSQQGPTVRFSFQKTCLHWDPAKNGKGAYCLYTLAIDAQEGKPGNHLPFETNGEVWWCDVPAAALGRAGQNVKILAVTSFRGKDGRGVTIEEYRQWKGRCAMAWQFVAKWDLA